ncbi:hypothetical protein PsorP6_015486 [Peronosclerospora sorghi]|uniref:Uncharacterized protein n=1 Tax=Peronosclerospora sorghi TaxID=230839 RepID=A0ACC0WS61_9STRA|nr:hypothetical protein PsorP6_015486 [Peronosclerospora sorghi]
MNIVSIMSSSSTSLSDFIAVLLTFSGPESLVVSSELVAVVVEDLLRYSFGFHLSHTIRSTKRN